MRYPFHMVDVFSSTPFGGNQLAVLPDAVRRSKIRAVAVRLRPWPGQPVLRQVDPQYRVFEGVGDRQ